MTSYEFEVAAKNAAIQTIKYKYDIIVDIEDINLVWFTHLLGNKKCMLFAPQIEYVYIEVTYSKEKNEMYVDVYEKALNIIVSSDKFNFEVE